MLPSQLHFGLCLNLSLDLTTVFVQKIELARNHPCFFGVKRGEQPNAKVRFADTASGIDPWTQCKAKI
jgi:hypothetical protein